MVFYVGDYDPAGVLIDVALQREMREHLKAEIELTFVRIGINEVQVELYGLPTKPRKEGDKRSQHMTYTVEAEAMPARILRSLLRTHVESLLPLGALASSKVAEQSEREQIERMAVLFDKARANV
jgi:F0F1-type ATP synthase gamma subunit